jgi:soluble lytic murein transglycosylase
MRHNAYLPITLSVLLLASACNLDGANLPTPNAENIIYVTATVPLPTPDAEGVIYITATPSGDSAAVVPQEAAAATANTPVLPSPIPFTQPTDALADANQLLEYGYYEEATRTFQNILAQGDQLAPEIRSEAAFKLGQAALREGLFSDAVDSLTLMINLFPQDARTPQAYFLRGDAYLGLSRWSEAIADFQQYLTLRPGLVDSYAYERIADAQLALGQFDAALTSYLQAINANRTLVPLLVLREKLARILIGAGRIADGVAQYDAILEVARNNNYRASIELLEAQALVQAGNLAEGLPHARRVFDNYNDTPSAYTAMQILLANGIAIDGFRRGKTAYNYGDYAGAIAAFNEFSSTVTLDQIPAELYLLLGRAYREIGNPSAALVAFQTINQQYPTDPLFGPALLEQGRTRFLSGDINGAIETYLGIARDYATLSETAAEALWRAGYLYGTNNNPVRSREVFTQLADNYPTSSWASNGLFLAASAAVNAQEWSVAENLYGRIAAITTGADRAAAYMWVGRLAQQRGDTRTAQDSYRFAQQAAPESFFAARAADLLNGVMPFTPPAQTRFTFDEAADQAEAEAWLRATFSISDQGSLSAPSAALAADPRMIRGTELWALGATDEALEEFKGILDEARSAKDALTSYQMAIYLKEIGAYSSSIVAAADVIVASGVATLQAPAYIARMRYPAYYLDLVLEQAARYQFDPLVLFALIRQESLYNATAVSSAGASGLTQVMPATGRYLAQQVGFADFTTSDLFRPHVAISFGANYIAEQLRRFDNNVAAALAAYNAGPGRAIDWVALSGGSLDALMLVIQINETKTYLERIYSHYAIYRTLYGG